MKKLLSLYVLFIALNCAAMEDGKQLPDTQALSKAFQEFHEFTDFLEKTKLIDNLAGKLIYAYQIRVIINAALRKYSFIKDCSEQSKECSRWKIVICAVILKDYPETFKKLREMEIEEEKSKEQFLATLPPEGANKF